MVLYALTMAPMSLVSPAREVSLLFAALIGGQLLGEGDRVVGAALDRLLDRLAPREAETALVGLELLNKAMEAALDDRFGDQAEPHR